MMQWCLPAVLASQMLRQQDYWSLASHVKPPDCHLQQLYCVTALPAMCHGSVFQCECHPGACEHLQHCALIHTVLMSIFMRLLALAYLLGWVPRVLEDEMNRTVSFSHLDVRRKIACISQVTHSFSHLLSTSAAPATRRHRGKDESRREVKS